MNRLGLLERSKTALLIIDVQERLMPVIHDRELVFQNVNRLIKGMGILSVPIVVTEQYPKGLGRTCTEIELPEEQVPIAKRCFSCLLSEDVLSVLGEKDIQSVILAGVESHICVLKTALDALKRGYEVHVVADAVSSRTLANKQLALARMRQSGAFVVSTEMVLFQLLDAAIGTEFKQISRLIK